eukprot:TRINITY_DN774140_c0_g1_i1.p1 TRINITY_DN774140_c0_g1~~TRINITY_DN774140_c0_g1_i1.p1  ORF type:complete len:345 (-),score=73.69 TRINITY_DN774140_c0_g1_i1:249-1283(-)
MKIVFVFIAILCCVLARENIDNPACHQNKCGTCTDQPECGFCASSFTCMAGDKDGPLVGSLECPEYWVFNSTETIRHGEKVSIEKAGCIPDVTMPEKEIVPNTFETDVICKNGGQRRWHYVEHLEKSFGGSPCDCPDGWGGYDCSMCMSDNVCSHSCVQDIYSIQETRSRSKKFSCECTGVTKHACKYLLGKYDSPSFRTIFDFHGLVPYQKSVGYMASFASVENHLPNMFLSGAIMAGNMTDCMFNPKTKCPQDDNYGWPDASEGCMSELCSNSNGHSPGGIKSHAQDPKSYRFYPGSHIIADFGEMNFYCNHNQWNNGTYYCAMNSDTIGPLALMCQTGSCV